MRRWNKIKVVAELKSRARELGHSPSKSEIPLYLYGVCNYYFGNLNNAKKAAGLSTQKMKYNPIKKSAYYLSNEFAYILGVVYGDGHCYFSKKKSRVSAGIVLKVRDYDFALHFKSNLEKWSGLQARLFLDKRMFYQTILHSVDAVRIIQNFDIKNIVSFDFQYQYHFLRGFFDSDGGIVGKNLNKRRYAKRWLHLSNSNKKLIYIVEHIFNQMNIIYSTTSRIHSGFDSKKLQYEIKVYNLKGIFKYYKYIGFSIKRKQDQLKNVIQSYEKFKNSKV